MSGPKQSPLEAQTNLAEEIRASEARYIDAATKLFRERIKMEYPRLRGYAIEAGSNFIELRVTLYCDFHRGKLDMNSCPSFVPEPGVCSTTVKPSNDTN